MDGRRSLGLHNNQQNNGVVGTGGGGVEKRRGRGVNVWGGRLLVVLGGELSVGKNTNRESEGALDFDGFCWMGGRNNQTKVGQNDGIHFWETAHRAMTIGEAAATLFGPSNYWTKINKTKFVMALGSHKSTIAHNTQPN